MLLFSRRLLLVLLVLPAVSVWPALGRPEKKEQLFPGTLDMDPKPIAKDDSVQYDYDIVYVRAPRKDDKERPHWAEVGDPRTMEPGSDLMLLHPDGSEEVLVPVKPHEAVARIAQLLGDGPVS